jgi:hypothetical protein
MKSIAQCSLVFVLCFVAVGALAAKTETLAESKARAEAARPEECIRLCIDLAQRELDEAKAQFAQGNNEAAKNELQSIATHAQKSCDGAILARKREKQLEIELRQISHRLGDLQRTLSFEDQPAVQVVMEQMERLRTRLLESMFGKGKK